MAVIGAEKRKIIVSINLGSVAYNGPISESDTYIHTKDTRFTLSPLIEQKIIETGCLAIDTIEKTSTRVYLPIPERNRRALLDVLTEFDNIPARSALVARRILNFQEKIIELAPTIDILEPEEIY
jgi:hypothetical protein